MVRYCKRCVTPDTWPDAIFDEDGICLPCRYFEASKQIDWGARRREVEDIADWGRRNKKGDYDCIIGVSGGKDSTRQAFYARDQLGLKSLLVSCAYPPEQTTSRGAHNLANLARHGFDIHIIAPSPRVSKALMKFSLENFGNLFRATELALYSTMPREAIALGVPLIFLGENPSLTFGGKVGSFDGDASRQRTHNTLSGADVTPWLAAGFEPRQLLPYCYPPEAEVQRAGLRIVYLGYYIQDFYDVENSRFAIEKGLEVRTGFDADPSNTGSINVADALDDDFVHVNQHLKSMKLGFGKVTQQVSVLIRHGKITREQGQELVMSYDGKCSDVYIDKLCAYLGMERATFEAIRTKLRNQDLWQINNHGDWELREPIDHPSEKASLS